jgi:hypothetical protein
MKVHHRSACLCVLSVLAALAFWSMPALALDPYDAPVLSCVSAGENEITIRICGGSGTGAPAGLTLHWMEKTLWDEFGWLSGDDPLLCAMSLSGQPSMMHPGASRWELMAGECEEVIIGDVNFDETGVSGQNCALAPLECGTEYVFIAFAHAGRRMGRSAWTEPLVCSTAPCPPEECTHTQGYWKRDTGQNPVFPDLWPLSVRNGGMYLGSVWYSINDLFRILITPEGQGVKCPPKSKPNGLYALAHQLIAAKLNVGIGATCPVGQAKIDAADQLIGNKIVGVDCVTPDVAAPYTKDLDAFNNGSLPGCPPHCEGDPPGLKGGAPSGNPDRPSEDRSWGSVKADYR